MSSDLHFGNFIRTLQGGDQAPSRVSYRLSNVYNCLQEFIASNKISDWTPKECDCFVSVLLVRYIHVAIESAQTGAADFRDSVASQVECIANLFAKGVVYNDFDAKVLMEICTSVMALGKRQIMPLSRIMLQPLIQKICKSDVRSIEVFDLIFLYGRQVSSDDVIKAMPDQTQFVTIFFATLKSEEGLSASVEVVRIAITHFMATKWPDVSTKLLRRGMIDALWNILILTSEPERESMAMEFLDGYEKYDEFVEWIVEDKPLLNILSKRSNVNTDDLIIAFAQESRLDWACLDAVFKLAHRESLDNFDAFMESFKLALKHISQIDTEDVIRGLETLDSIEPDEMRVISVLITCVIDGYEGFAAMCFDRMCALTSHQLPTPISRVLLPALGRRPAGRQIVLDYLLVGMDRAMPLSTSDLGDVLDNLGPQDALRLLSTAVERRYEGVKTLRVIISHCQLPLSKAMGSYIIDIFTQSPEGWQSFGELVSTLGGELFCEDEWSYFIDEIVCKVNLCDKALACIRAWGRPQSTEASLYQQIRMLFGLLDNFVFICSDSCLNELFQCFTDVLNFVPIDERSEIMKQFVTVLFPSYAKVRLLRCLLFTRMLIQHVEGLFQDESLNFARLKPIHYPNAFNIEIRGRENINLMVTPNTVIQEVVNCVAFLAKRSSQCISIEINGAIVNSMDTIGDHNTKKLMDLRWIEHSKGQVLQDQQLFLPSILLVKGASDDLSATTRHDAFDWMFSYIEFVAEETMIQACRTEAWKVLKMLPLIPDLVEMSNNKEAVFGELSNPSNYYNRMYCLRLWLRSLGSSEFVNWFRSNCLSDLEKCFEMDYDESVLHIIVKLMAHSEICGSISFDEQLVRGVVDNFMRMNSPKICFLLLKLLIQAKRTHTVNMADMDNEFWLKFCETYETYHDQFDDIVGAMQDDEKQRLLVCLLEFWKHKESIPNCAYSMIKRIVSPALSHALARSLVGYLDDLGNTKFVDLLSLIGEFIKRCDVPFDNDAKCEILEKLLGVGFITNDSAIQTRVYEIISSVKENTVGNKEDSAVLLGRIDHQIQESIDSYKVLRDSKVNDPLSPEEMAVMSDATMQFILSTESLSHITCYFVVVVLASSSSPWINKYKERLLNDPANSHQVASVLNDKRLWSTFFSYIGEPANVSNVVTSLSMSLIVNFRGSSTLLDALITEMMKMAQVGSGHITQQYFQNANMILGRLAIYHASQVHAKGIVATYSRLINTVRNAGLTPLPDFSVMALSLEACIQAGCRVGPRNDDGDRSTDSNSTETFSKSFLTKLDNDLIVKALSASNDWRTGVLSFVQDHLDSILNEHDKLCRCFILVEICMSDIQRQDYASLVEQLCLHLVEFGEMSCALRLLMHYGLPVNVVAQLLREHLDAYVSIVCQSCDAVFAEFFDALDPVFIQAPDLLDLIAGNQEFKEKAKTTTELRHFTDVAFKLRDNDSVTTSAADLCAECASNCLRLVEPMTYVLAVKGNIKRTLNYFSAFIGEYRKLTPHLEELSKILKSLVNEIPFIGNLDDISVMIPDIWNESYSCLYELFLLLASKSQASDAAACAIRKQIDPLDLTSDHSWKQRLTLLHLSLHIPYPKFVQNVGAALVKCAEQHPEIIHKELPGKCLAEISSFLSSKKQRDHISWATLLYSRLITDPSDDPNVNTFFEMFWRNISNVERSRVISGLQDEVTSGVDSPPGILLRRRQLLALAQSIEKERGT